MIASKLFSAFAETPRKQDKQDAIAALDQKLVEFASVARIADQIFDLHQMDARAERFPKVYAFLMELSETYGTVRLNYNPVEGAN